MWSLREMVHNMMVFLVLLSLVDDLLVFLHLDSVVIYEGLKLVIFFAKFVLIFVLNMSLVRELGLEITLRLLLFLVCIL